VATVYAHAVISFDVHIDHDELASRIAARLGVGSTPWMSKAEAVEYSRVLAWMTKGLPHVQVKRRLLLDRRAVDEWLMSSYTR
jgi:hypothetical protein